MRTLTYPIVNPKLEAVPFNEYLERVHHDPFTGTMWLDGERIEQFLAVTITIPNGATEDQVLQMLVDWHRNGGTDAS